MCIRDRFKGESNLNEAFALISSTQKKEDFAKWLLQAAIAVNQSVNTERDNTTKQVIQEARQYIMAVSYTHLAIPFLVTGGIHMDGFMDTMDAVHSYGDRTKKLEILKDPHLGAFAVICAAVYLLLYTGSMYEFCKNAQGKAIFYPVLFLSSARVFSGLSVIRCV